MMEQTRLVIVCLSLFLFYGSGVLTFKVNFGLAAPVLLVNNIPRIHRMNYCVGHRVRAQIRISHDGRPSRSKARGVEGLQDGYISKYRTPAMSALFSRRAEAGIHCDSDQGICAGREQDTTGSHW